MDYQEYEQQLANKYLQMRTGFWNGLLTINGILLSIIAAAIFVGIVQATYLIQLLLLFAAISVIGILYLFYSSSSFYKELGSLSPEGFAKKSDKDRKNDLKRAYCRGKVFDWIEKLLGVLLIFELLVLLISILRTRP